MLTAHDAISMDYTTAVTPETSRPARAAMFASGRSQPANSKVIGVMAQDKHAVLLAYRSPSGQWYCVVDELDRRRLLRIRHALVTPVDSNGECQKAAWPRR